MNDAPEPSVTNPTPVDNGLYVPPRNQAPSAAKLRKLALGKQSHRLYVIAAKPGTPIKVGETKYNIGPAGNLQKLAPGVKERKPTRRGRRGR